MSAAIPTVVTERPDAPPDGTVAQTPAGEPNVKIKTMKPWQIVLVRAGRVYVQALLGMLSAGGLAGIAIGQLAGDPLSLVLTAAKLAAWPAVMSLLQNSGELLAKLDMTAPKIRA